jgi:2-polyprenyl-3-methyl-5-hydroxy-6-metoxy-1,4-benzoquinol methylase
MYKIKENYSHREIAKNFNDLENTDEWQKEVYEKALEISIEYNYKIIVDVGTGSAYKLIKYFNDYETIGYDISKTVNKLKEKYPGKHWRDDFVPTKCDLLIASDVIEHLQNPTDLINFIRKSSPAKIILSTPDRELINTNQNGPPKNRSHYREWNFKEFNEYINDYFLIEEHFISNKQQGTQVIIAKLKGENNALV